MSPVAKLLDGGQRLHLQHGPIDLIIGAVGENEQERTRSFSAAKQRFETILDGLVYELPALRQQLHTSTPLFNDPVARRMRQAALPHCENTFLTPMIAVAGSVAEEVLEAMVTAISLRRAYVNNGGDIALHLQSDETFSIAMASADQFDLGRIMLKGEDGVCGIATSGVGGRSHSFGIADSVTVLAASASKADVAATLIANAIDLPEHKGVVRQKASTLNPDSDLGSRLVVTSVPKLADFEAEKALRSGQSVANKMLSDGLIFGSAMFLQGAYALCGEGFEKCTPQRELEYV